MVPKNLFPDVPQDDEEKEELPSTDVDYNYYIKWDRKAEDPMIGVRLRCARCYVFYPMCEILQHYCKNVVTDNSYYVGIRICHGCLRELQGTVMEGIPLGCINCKRFCKFDYWKQIGQDLPHKWHTDVTFFGTNTLPEWLTTDVFEDINSLGKEVLIPPLVRTILDWDYRNGVGYDSPMWRAYYGAVKLTDASHTSRSTMTKWNQRALGANNQFRYYMSRSAIAWKEYKEFVLWIWHCSIVQDAQKSNRGIPDWTWDDTPAMNFVLQMQRLDPADDSLVYDSYQYARKRQEERYLEARKTNWMDIPEELEYAQKRREERQRQREHPSPSEQVEESPSKKMETKPTEAGKEKVSKPNEDKKDFFLEVM